MESIEIWHDVKGYEGIYKFSTLGRIKSVARKMGDAPGVTRKMPERIMKQAVNNKGYMTVMLSRGDRKRRPLFVHRIIAQAIPNPENKPCVNHKDGNPKNNKINNLEWCTQKENTRHGWEHGLMENVRAAVSKRCKTTLPEINKNPVKNLTTGKIYPSIKDAAEAYSLPANAISNALRSKGKSRSGGCFWAYEGSSVTTTD